LDQFKQVHCINYRKLIIYARKLTRNSIPGTIIDTAYIHIIPPNTVIIDPYREAETIVGRIILVGKGAP